MAERYLKIEVTREQVSEVYVRVDDSDPKYADVFKGVRERFKGRRMTETLRAAARQAAAELDDFQDWETDPHVSSGPANEVTAAEANQFAVWDATKPGGEPEVIEGEAD